MTGSINLDQFFKDRDEAMLSLDKDKILAYMVRRTHHSKRECVLGRCSQSATGP
jgi:hypothetical protein